MKDFVDTVAVIVENDGRLLFERWMIYFGSVAAGLMPST